MYHQWVSGVTPIKFWPLIINIEPLNFEILLAKEVVKLEYTSAYRRWSLKITVYRWIKSATYPCVIDFSVLILFSLAISFIQHYYMIMPKKKISCTLNNNLRGHSFVHCKTLMHWKNICSLYQTMSLLDKWKFIHRTTDWHCSTVIKQPIQLIFFYEACSVKNLKIFSFFGWKRYNLKAILLYCNIPELLLDVIRFRNDGPVLIN